MATKAELLEDIRKGEAAEKKARACLKKRWNTLLKAEAFDKILPLAKEYLEQRLKEGRVSHHVDEAFNERVLLACFGQDFFDWCFDLLGDSS
jgi:hypothetical protein